MHEYNAIVRRVIDGDTMDVTLDLGFDILYNNRIRFFGINTPESRTKDLVEKKKGLAAKERVRELCPVGSSVIIKTTKDERGKYGRILGEIFVKEVEGLPTMQNTAGYSVNKLLVDEGHAVEYFGGSR